MVKTLPSILLLALTFSSATLPTFAEKPKPNIIVIFTDNHGYADLSCQGIMKDVKTPNIDSIAANGVRMASGYVTAPQCGPSRCGLISGQYQGKFGMDNNGSWGDVSGLKEKFFSLNNLPKRMKSVGYTTGMAGKSHLGSDDSADLVKLGFDRAFFKHSDGPGHWNMDLTGKDVPPQVQKGGDYHLEAITAFACTFIERFKTQPFFFYLAYRGPHVPLDAPKKYLDRYPGPMPEERRKALGALSCIDDGIGRILETLRKNGLEENTLIFLIGDNGAPLKMIPFTYETGPDSLKTLKPGTPSGGGNWDGSLNVPMNGEKGMLSEGGIRTPFVLQWKGTIPGGQVYQNPVISLDVAATATAISGQVADPTLDGVNLLPFLTGENKGRPHEALYWRWMGQFVIRKGDSKYVCSGDRQYLFDLASDPEEKHNLLPQQAELGRNLRSELETWSKSLTPSGLTGIPISKATSNYFDYYYEGKKIAPRTEKSPEAQERKNKRKAEKNSGESPE